MRAVRIFGGVRESGRVLEQRIYSVPGRSGGGGARWSSGVWWRRGAPLLLGGIGSSSSGGCSARSGRSFSLLV